MNALSVFQFEANEVRTIIINGDPWFIAKDIAEALGYADTDQAIRKHCKRAQSCPVEMTGQVRQAKIIPEGDMFRLIVKSQLPSAEKFESWVMDEVLPSIRKTGSYNMAASPFQRPEVEATGVFDAFLVLGKKMGFDENMAAFSANHATTKIVNVNVLELMGVTRLLAPKQTANFTPKELGEQMNPPCTAIKVNEMLVRLGYQVRTKVKLCPYETTEKGKPFCRMHDVSRTNAAGTSQQLRWYINILDQEDVQWATGLLQMNKAA